MKKMVLLLVTSMLIVVEPISNVTAQTQSPRMAENADPAFEVATVRPSNPDNKSRGFHSDGRQIFIENESVTALVMFAYAMHPKQIVGGPSWIDDRYDIHGTTDLPGEPNRIQLRSMLRKLLEDRFQLKVRRDEREMPAYTITVAKGGPKLQPSKSEPNGPSDQDGSGGAQGQTMKYTNISMDDFALGMQYYLDRPAVNRTGLPGRYDFTLQWQPRVSATPNPSDFPDLFTAVQEQLGLRLKAERATVPVLVIESISRPSQN